jgi:hypothetical protein
MQNYKIWPAAGLLIGTKPNQQFYLESALLGTIHLENTYYIQCRLQAYP